MQEQDLVYNILHRDRKALHEFYLRYTPRLERLIRLKIANPHDAEEVLQDTLFAFLEALRDFNGECKLETFLFSICQHKIIDYYRRRKINQVVFSRMPALGELVSPLRNPEEVLDGKILKERIKQAFAEILPKYRGVLHLKYVEDRSVAEIAHLCASTIKATESMLFRARKAFVKAFVSQ